MFGERLKPMDCRLKHEEDKLASLNYLALILNTALNSYHGHPDHWRAGRNATATSSQPVQVAIDQGLTALPLRSINSPGPASDRRPVQVAGDV